jgi:hypothetical protein
MNDAMAFDRMIAAALTDGPLTADAGVVEAALATASSTRQRNPRVAFLDRQAWPPSSVPLADPQLRRNLRLALVAALALAAVAATIIVGARLLEQRQPIPFSLRAQFVAAPLLPDKFEAFTAIRLADGSVAFVGPQWVNTDLGPQWGSTVVNIWDPTSRQMRTAFVGTAASWSAYAPLPGDRLLVVDAGGQFPSDARKSASVIDLRTGATTPTGDATRYRLSYATLAVADGRVLVTGGEPPETSTTLPEDSVDGEPALASAEVYDPATGRFSPVGPMTAGREGHAMVQLADGRVLVLGGYNGSQQDPPPSTLSSAELFDPATGRFTVTGRLGTPRSSLQAPLIRLRDGRVLVIGGTSDDARAVFDSVAKRKYTTGVSTELYDPATGLFTPGPEVPHAVFAATLLEDGAVLLVGSWWESFQGRAERFLGDAR